MKNGNKILGCLVIGAMTVTSSLSSGVFAFEPACISLDSANQNLQDAAVAVNISGNDALHASFPSHLALDDYNLYSYDAFRAAEEAYYATFNVVHYYESSIISATYRVADYTAYATNTTTMEHPSNATTLEMYETDYASVLASNSSFGYDTLSSQSQAALTAAENVLESIVNYEKARLTVEAVENNTCVQPKKPLGQRSSINISLLQSASNILQEHGSASEEIKEMEEVIVIQSKKNSYSSISEEIEVIEMREVQKVEEVGEQEVTKEGIDTDEKIEEIQEEIVVKEQLDEQTQDKVKKVTTSMKNIIVKSQDSEVEKNMVLDYVTKKMNEFEVSGDTHKMMIAQMVLDEMSM